MADGPSEDRVFTEQEVRRILKKAVELAPSRTRSPGQGLSLTELKAIGEEAGIDPARMEQAVRAVMERRGGLKDGILGGPTILNVERTAAGEFGREDIPQVLSIIRRTTGRHGEVTEIGGLLEWSDRAESGERHVTLSSKDGTTTITGAANLSNVAVLTYLPAGMIGLITAAITFIASANDGNAVGMVAGLAIVPALYTLLREIFGRISAGETARMEKVVDELARLTKGAGD